jgi:methylenetetrahydrofolate dehydrogenase (NADP+)/methenyltetrahydrofolate cyclohydrolase
MDNILDGSKVSCEIKDKLKIKVDKLKEVNVTPGLSVILVGDNIESVTYVTMKKKSCDKLGINCDIIKLSENTSETEIINKIKTLNDNLNVHGILVQLPLPHNIDDKRVLNSIIESKDVDGLCDINMGRLINETIDSVKSCTPRGCMELLDYYNIELEGKDVIIIGSSNLVGLPLSIMMMKKNATVTTCNIYTKDLQSKVLVSDIVVSCCGVAHLIKEDWITEGAIVIDIGINKISDNSEKGYKIVGDVDYENVKEKTEMITPVPGGIGPMTIAILLKQVIELCERLISNI